VATDADIVISVEKKYLMLMLSGEKTIELRRRTVNVATGSRIWIYTKAPSAHISAYASVKDVITGTPKSIWRSYREQVGISLEEYESYFEGSSMACAIRLRDVCPMVPAVKLSELRSRLDGFHPPQFFKRLHKGSPGSLLLRSHAG
jgi:predicted transcriptional regulator